MKYWKIKKGNTSVQDIPIYDKAGALLDNLADATYIKFQIKENKEDALPKISKTVGSGIEVNTPSAGHLRITLTPTDTNALAIANYFIAIEIKWSSVEIYEIILEMDGQESDMLSIKQDTIQ